MDYTHKLKKAVLSVAAAALCLSMATSAQAGTIVSVTVTGTILAGTDDANLYGGGNLAGHTLTTTITYDATTLLYDATHPTVANNGVYQQHAGLTVWNDCCNNVMTSTTVIDGHTFITNSLNQAYLLACNEAECGGNRAFIAQNSGSNNANQLHVFSNSSTLLTDFSSGTAIATWINTYGEGASIVSQVGNGPQDFFLLLSVTATGSTIESTPEPGTWALLSLGMGAVAFVKRRRTVNS